MTRTITVKGVGTATVKPDFVILSLSVEARNEDYEKAMQEATHKIETLQAAIQTVGYDKTDLKTTNFNVRTDYESKKDRNGIYRSVFVGYVCSYRLTLSFDFENTRLSRTLTAIAAREANPEMRIAFTVKNPSEINEELLRSATENAKRKAEILCSASGETLGSLLTIDYNWGEINVVSQTRYDLDECMRMMAASEKCMPEIEPDDINASDTATFVWEIS